MLRDRETSTKTGRFVALCIRVVLENLSSALFYSITQSYIENSKRTLISGERKLEHHQKWRLFFAHFSNASSNCRVFAWLNNKTSKPELMVITLHCEMSCIWRHCTGVQCACREQTEWSFFENSVEKKRSLEQSHLNRVNRVRIPVCDRWNRVRLRETSRRCIKVYETFTCTCWLEGWKESQGRTSRTTPCAKVPNTNFGILAYQKLWLGSSGLKNVKNSKNVRKWNVMFKTRNISAYEVL